MQRESEAGCISCEESPTLLDFKSQLDTQSASYNQQLILIKEACSGMLAAFLIRTIHTQVALTPWVYAGPIRGVHDSPFGLWCHNFILISGQIYKRVTIIMIDTRILTRLGFQKLQDYNPPPLATGQVILHSYVVRLSLSQYIYTSYMCSSAFSGIFGLLENLPPTHHKSRDLGQICPWQNR
jgi:hypothetical protein